MKHRKLRIVWSVVWGVVAVLICVLWVRSYWWEDSIFRTDEVGDVIDLQSGFGQVILHTEWNSLASGLYIPGDYNFSSRFDPEYVRRDYHHGKWNSRFDARWRTEEYWLVAAPHWFITTVLTVIAAAPWLSYRFSLRTLLIATTAIAVLLGLIASLR